MYYVKYFGEIVTIDEMVKDLRKKGVDPNNDLSDDFLIDEAYQIGEWEEVTPDQLKTFFKLFCLGYAIN